MRHLRLGTSRGRSPLESTGPCSATGGSSSSATRPRATDPLTGEGIAQALITGVLAAEAIIAGGALRPGLVRQRYEREVRRHLFADHRMSVVLGGLLRHRFAARGSVRLAGLNDWTRRNFARWLFEDEPRAIVFTPRRWHRGFLARAGAWADGRHAESPSSPGSPGSPDG